MLDGDMIVDSVHTPLDDCPEGFNTVSVLSVTLGEFNLMIHHDTNEILRVLHSEVILQELNRMQLVLERMTRNIVANIRKERLANEIKDIANKHNGNEQSRKKNP